MTKPPKFTRREAIKWEILEYSDPKKVFQTKGMVSELDTNINQFTNHINQYGGKISKNNIHSNKKHYGDNNNNNDNSNSSNTNTPKNVEDDM